MSPLPPILTLRDLPGEAFPSASDQQRFWNQCQHQTWYFLPWHRGYLLGLEAVVRDAGLITYEATGNDLGHLVRRARQMPGIESATLPSWCSTSSLPVE